MHPRLLLVPVLLLTAACAAHGRTPAPDGPGASPVVAGGAAPTSDATSPAGVASTAAPQTSGQASGQTSGQTSGPVVTAAGAFLGDAAGLPSIAAQDDCHRLVPDSTESVVSCVTATTARGTVTAVYQVCCHSGSVVVYRRDGDRAVPVLVEHLPDNGARTDVLLATVDPEHDGSTKVVVAPSTPVAGSSTRPRAGYDLVDVPGTVTLHRDLGGGAVGLDADGRLVDWSAAGEESTVRYEDGAWHLAAQRPAAVPSMPQVLQSVR